MIGFLLQIPQSWGQNIIVPMYNIKARKLECQINQSTLK